jgi:hypothetical protein
LGPLAPFLVRIPEVCTKMLKIEDIQRYVESVKDIMAKVSMTSV